MAKEPEIEIIGTGSIPAEELPEGAKVIEMPAQEQPKKKLVQEVLEEDINFLRGLNFNLDEVQKFGLILTKIKQDLIDCVIALNKKREEKNGNADAE